MPKKAAASKKNAGTLVIVESPTKAKTIGRFLGSGYTVLSSFGHIRDLPKSELGIDVEHAYAPRYVIPTDKRKRVSELKKAAAAAGKVWFATDEDREGEAISWHLAEIFGLPDDKVERITFHEITETAIKNALEHPRKIDRNLVNAQQARRILDRLVGYTLSPFLWKKVAKGLSAGRVQSVAVRLIVEREREILAFVPREYWTVEAQLKTPRDESFPARLFAKNGETLDKFALATQADAEAAVTAVRAATLSVSSVERKQVKKSPSAPYTTSTLQQDANRKLGFSAKQTMLLAQQLYEGVKLGDGGEVGLITYMRTDSTSLAQSFTDAAAAYIEKTFGKKYRPEQPRTYVTKSKGAQEAHESVRPTDAARTPESVEAHLSDQQAKLYDLIWRRAVASQMPDAQLEATTVDIAAGEYTLRSTGSVVAFDGFLALTPESQKDTLLPVLTEKEPLAAESIEPKQHFTEPPARYSDASLVKVLEEHGIGRPSTYAPTIATITERGYVERIENRRLKPTDIAFAVTDLLVAHFPQIVDTEFTAKMEEEFDTIAEGGKEWAPVIDAFYKPYAENLAAKEKEIIKKVVEDVPTDMVCEKCGKPMVIKTGRFGKFYACTGFPECRNTKPYDKDEAGNELPPETTDEKCQLCGKPMEIREGRFGKYLRCTGYPECEGKKPLHKGTGVTCPKCGEGEIVEKRSKRGKIFYACNRYPKCDQAYWQKPTGEKCPKCGSLLTFAAKGEIRCSNKECGYVKPSETGPQTP
ncbi:type I DNA topoisomerase [Patescibacteria group bacterium]|nr:MAG: type I DNA topoisomerase [Patescibacteria group bacterium]